MPTLDDFDSNKKWSASPSDYILTAGALEYATLFFFLLHKKSISIVCGFIFLLLFFIFLLFFGRTSKVIKTNINYFATFAAVLMGLDIVSNFNGGKGYYTMGSLTAFGTAELIFIQTCINLVLGGRAFFEGRPNAKDYFISPLVMGFLFMPAILTGGVIMEMILRVSAFLS